MRQLRNRKYEHEVEEKLDICDRTVVMHIAGAEQMMFRLQRFGNPILFGAIYLVTGPTSF